MMNIKITKTKIVIFQKKRRKSTTLKHQFYINNEKIEITNSYTYLGVKFSANGRFKEHKQCYKDTKTREPYLQLVSTLTFLDFQ